MSSESIASRASEVEHLLRRGLHAYVSVIGNTVCVSAQVIPGAVRLLPEHGGYDAIKWGWVPYDQILSVLTRAVEGRTS